MERPFPELATEAKYQHTPFGGRRQIAPRTRTEANATEQTTERPSDRATERPSDRDRAPVVSQVVSLSSEPSLSTSNHMVARIRYLSTLPATPEWSAESNRRRMTAAA